MLDCEFVNTLRMLLKGIVVVIVSKLEWEKKRVWWKRIERKKWRVGTKNYRKKEKKGG